MKITHTYSTEIYKEEENEETGKTATISGTTTIGNSNVYTEILIPFQLNMEDEKFVLSGDGIRKKMIIQEK